jgi:hypothetical protein
VANSRDHSNYYYYFIINYLTAIGLQPGGSSTTIGHNRQVTHTQSNNTFKQYTKHNNKGHPTTMNTKQIRLATTASTRENTNTTTTRKKHK